MKKIMSIFCFLLMVGSIAKAQTETKYTPPQLVSPAKEKVFDKNIAKSPLILRWTPIVPKTQEKVIYEVRIVEVNEEQSTTDAFRTNNVLFEKQVTDQTQLIVNFAEISRGLIKGAKENFAWSVIALDSKTNQPLPNGQSDISTFSLLSSADITITNFQVDCGRGFGNYTFTLSVQNFGTASFQLNTISLSPSITGLTFTPPLPVIIPASGTQTFTGSFTYTGTTYPNLVYANATGNQVGNVNLTSTDTDLDTLKACLCSDCERLVVNMDDIRATPFGTSGSQYNLTGNLIVTGLPAVYGVEFQLLSYDFTASPGSCTNGVTSIEESGVFLKPNTSINGSTTFLMFNETVSGSPSTNNNASKTIKLSSTSPLPSSIPYVLNVGLPAAISGLGNQCCRIEYRVCVKVRIFYDKATCNSCTFTKCITFTN